MSTWEDERCPGCGGYPVHQPGCTNGGRAGAAVTSNEWQSEQPVAEVAPDPDPEPERVEGVTYADAYEGTTIIPVVSNG